MHLPFLQGRILTLCVWNLVPTLMALELLLPGWTHRKLLLQAFSFCNSLARWKASMWNLRWFRIRLPHWNGNMTSIGLTSRSHWFFSNASEATLTLLNFDLVQSCQECWVAKDEPLFLGNARLQRKISRETEPRTGDMAWKMVPLADA